MVIGHRANAPRILRWYLKIGVPIIEVDVRYVNGEFLVLHGPSSIKRASIPGKIMAWIDYHFFYRDPLLRRVKLVEVLEKVNGRADINIDIKQPGFEEDLLNLINSVGFEGKVYVTSQIHPIIRRIKELDSKILTIASLNILPIDPVKVVLDARADIVSVHVSIVSRELIKQLHEAGLKVLAWTVNDRETILKHMELGVDGIVTDRPDIALNVIKHREEVLKRCLP